MPQPCIFFKLGDLILFIGVHCNISKLDRVLRDVSLDIVDRSRLGNSPISINVFGGMPVFGIASRLFCLPAELVQHFLVLLVIVLGHLLDDVL